MAELVTGLLCSAGCFVIKKIAHTIYTKIDSHIKSKKNPIKTIFGKIETKFPKINGSGLPWIDDKDYFKSFKTEPVNITVDMDANRKNGTVLIPFQKVQSVPSVRIDSGVLTVSFDYGSEIDLEIGENFTTSNTGEAYLDFGVPGIIIKPDVHYDEKIFHVPMKFDMPVKRIKPLNYQYPKAPAQGSKKIELPFGRKVDAEIPVLSFKI
nr:hypothetical protein [Candidatus Sigynarchaeum springense]MDO8118447.1 hypothetical protein [Candidatus Sigynarchaeota archaeon]